MMRDITLGDTIDFKFTTCAASGAPTTLSGTPSIAAYVGNGTTEITAGITLTVDFDARTGLNNVRVVASAGNGFADGTDVALIITAGTVGGTSVVGYKVAEFTIGRAAAHTRLGAPAGASIAADLATIDNFVDTEVAAIASDVATLIARLTSARAGYLDNLSAGAVALQSTASAIETDTQDIQSRLPAALVSGRMSSDVVAISGDTAAADALETAFDSTDGPVPLLGIVDQGTAQAATSTTVQLRAAAAFGDDTLIGCIIGVFGSTQGYWQFRAITDYVSSTDTATVDAWAVTPTGTITYKIFGTAPVSGGGGGLDAAGVRAAIGLASANLDTQLSTIDTVVDRIEVDTQDIQARIPAALVGGRIDATVDGTGMEAGAVTAIQSGLATAAALDTVDNFLDTEIASILSDLSTLLTRLSATRAGYLDNLSGGAVATAAALATVDTVVDNIEADTQDIQSRLPAALDTGYLQVSVKRVGTTTLNAAGTGGQSYGA